MRIAFTPEIKKQLKQLKKTKPQTLHKLELQLLLFTRNPRHPSLRLHKLRGNLKHAWSISVERNFRILFYISSDKAVFFKMGTHNEVYGK